MGSAIPQAKKVVVWGVELGGVIGLDNYKVLLYRNEPEGWVAEVPAIEGCYALMATRKDALAD